MKKFIKSVVAFLLAVCMTMLFTACDNDIFGGGSNGGNEVTGGNETGGGSGEGDDPAQNPSSQTVAAVYVSDGTYTSESEAIRAFVRNELGKEGALTARYVSHTEVKGDKIVAAGVDEKYNVNGLTSVLKMKVSANIAGESGEAAMMFPAETVEQSAYLIDFGNGKIRYMVAEPEEGERMTNSYAATVLDYDKYENCTLNISSVKLVGGNAAFYSGEEIKMTRTAAYYASYYTQEHYDKREPAYNSETGTSDTERFYFKNSDDRETVISRSYSSDETPAWNTSSHSYDFENHKKSEFTDFLNELLPLAPAFFENAGDRFVMKIAVPDEDRKEECFSVVVKDGAISRHNTNVSVASSGVVISEIAFSDFGTTTVQLPDEAEIPEEKIVLKVLLGNTQDQIVYAAALQKAGEKLGITVNVKHVSLADYRTALYNMVAMGNLPDIVLLQKEHMRKLAEVAILDDISEPLAADKYSDKLSDLLPWLKGEYKFDFNTSTWGSGATYGIPIGSYAFALGYNKTLISERRELIESAFGGDTAVPRNADGSVKLPWEMNFGNENYTWEQYRTMAAALAQDRNVYGSDIPDVEILTRSFGGKLITDNMQSVLVDSDPFKQAMTYTAMLVDSGAAVGGQIQDLRGGRLCFSSRCDFSMREVYNQTLGKGNWGVMPFPVSEDTAPDDWCSLRDSLGLGVTTECKNKNKAVELIMELLDSEVQSGLVADGISLPVTESGMTEFLGSDTDTVEYKNRSVFASVITEKGFTRAYQYCIGYDWMNEVNCYVMIVQNSSRGDASRRLYSDAQYADFCNRVQSVYDETEKDYY